MSYHILYDLKLLPDRVIEWPFEESSKIQTLKWYFAKMGTIIQDALNMLRQ